MSRHVPRVEILAIGDELAHGITIDTNSAWLARRVENFGLAVGRLGVISDDRAELAAAVAEAAARADIVLLSGGLGPTDDDRTRAACADAAGVELVFDERSWKQIQVWFRLAKREMPETNRRQAELPAGAAAIENRHGTAPGFELAIGAARLFAMPGVPREMRRMFDDVVAERLGTVLGDAVRPLVVREVHVYGPGEAALGERITDLMSPADPRFLGGGGVGITARDAVLRVRIAARGDDGAAAAAAADGVVADVCGRLQDGELLYVGGEELAEKVGGELIARELQLAVAESCTGGLLAAALTEWAGISAAFPGGYVTYADAAKADALGVDLELLADEGAVSESVVRAMARGASERMDADLAVAISGVAGPSGGSEAKPVGTVCFALHDRRDGETRAWTRHLPDLGRGYVRRRSVVEALAAVLRVLTSESRWP